MFETKFVERVKNTNFVFGNFSPENPAVYEIMRSNVVEPDRPHMKI